MQHADHTHQLDNVFLLRLVHPGGPEQHLRPSYGRFGARAISGPDARARERRMIVWEDRFETSPRRLGSIFLGFRIRRVR